VAPTNASSPLVGATEVGGPILVAPVLPELYLPLSPASSLGGLRRHRSDGGLHLEQVLTCAKYNKTGATPGDMVLLARYLYTSGVPAENIHCRPCGCTIGNQKISKAKKEQFTTATLSKRASPASPPAPTKNDAPLDPQT
jgi:hypothetical protein